MRFSNHRTCQSTWRLKLLTYLTWSTQWPLRRVEPMEGALRAVYSFGEKINWIKVARKMAGGCVVALVSRRWPVSGHQWFGKGIIASGHGGRIRNQPPHRTLCNPIIVVTDSIDGAKTRPISNFHFINSIQVGPLIHFHLNHFRLNVE